MLGDHIRALKGGRWLHGIDLGDQRILYLDETPGLPPGDRLRRVYRPEFTAGASRVETVVHREPAYPAKAVVARAWSRFMDPSALAALSSSQQFAEWCKVGRVPAVAAPALLPGAAAAAVPPAPRPAPVAPPAGPPAAASKAAPVAAATVPAVVRSKPAKSAVAPKAKKTRAPGKGAAPARARPAKSKRAKVKTATSKPAARVAAKAKASRPAAKAARKPAPRQVPKAKGKKARR